MIRPNIGTPTHWYTYTLVHLHTGTPPHWYTYTGRAVEEPTLGGGRLPRGGGAHCGRLPGQGEGGGAGLPGQEQAGGGRRGWLSAGEQEDQCGSHQGQEVLPFNLL